jgi:hypothetical protein
MRVIQIQKLVLRKEIPEMKLLKLMKWKPKNKNTDKTKGLFLEKMNTMRNLLVKLIK